MVALGPNLVWSITGLLGKDKFLKICPLGKNEFFKIWSLGKDKFWKIWPLGKT
jgi:hypothetical protein